jgi:TolB protein
MAVSGVAAAIMVRIMVLHGDKTKYMRQILINALLLLSLVSGAQKKEYRVVYNVLEDAKKDNYQIYSMNMDGSGKKNISRTTGVDWVYYAYKDKVYFISDRDTCHRCYFLYEMDADGNGVRKISNLQLEDSWMGSRNKGTEMIVTGRVGSTIRSQLFIINLKTGVYQQITNDTVCSQNDPLFLPDNRIVWRYRPDKKLRRTVPDELWLMREDGSGKQQLTHYPPNDTTAEWFRYHAGPPQWNNRHRFISYISHQKGQVQIFAITPDGKKQWQITSDTLNSGWHAWSDDGNWLVMDKSTRAEKEYDIYLMNYRTLKTICISSDPKTEQAPVLVRAPRNP